VAASKIGDIFIRTLPIFLSTKLQTGGYRQEYSFAPIYFISPKTLKLLEKHSSFLALENLNYSDSAPTARGIPLGDYLER